jgi:rod shape-determining protein MreD
MLKRHHAIIRQKMFIFLSFVVAWILMIVPMPLEAYWLRPEWLTLTLIYWIFTAPGSVGIFSAWCVGLVMDSLYGHTLGQYALSMVIIAFFAHLLRYRIKVMPFWQQGLAVFVLVICGQGVLFLAQWCMHYPPKTLLSLVPSVISVGVWFLVKRLLQHQRQKILA